MSLQYDIVHTTTYRYHEPVRFGEHRVMFRPRDSHDQRVLATDLTVTPEADVRLIHDPHSNSIALVRPRVPADTLSIVCSFTIEHVQVEALEHPLAPGAEHMPVAYGVEERYDLEHYLRPHHDDPDGVLVRWSRSFLQHEGPTPTRDLLRAMNERIHAQLRYEVRREQGTQHPLVTLERGSGSCRDYALLMMEAVRRLGLAARFVTGYLYDPALDAGLGAEPGTEVSGRGDTHAWLQVYLPGAGWVGFDPTHSRLGDMHLIRVAVVRDPAQAAPISGTYAGSPEAYAGMEVSVQVTRRRD